MAAFLMPEVGVHAQSSETPTALQRAGIEERLGETVPGDVVLLNEQGDRVTIGQYLQANQPVVLNFVYHECPTLCSFVLEGLTRAMQEMDWVPGEDFQVLTVSFSPSESPALARKQKEKYLLKLAKPDAADGWHFLVGQEAEVQRLGDAVGFQYEWDDRTNQYAHSAALVLLSPEGVVTRYLWGFQYKPLDLRASLMEASDGTIGTTVDRLVLYCYRYDAEAGSYVPFILNIMKLGGLLTLLVLGTLLVILWRGERARRLRADITNKNLPESYAI
jgi:protein SCO1/2